MCHLILALPFVALPMLWLLPPGIGIPLYGFIVALAIWVYALAFKAMRRPVTTGAEALMNAIGTVRSADRRTAGWRAKVGQRPVPTRSSPRATPSR